MSWHPFIPGRKYRREEVVAVLSRFVHTGGVKHVEGKAEKIDEIRNFESDELLYDPRGTGWGASPLNPNSWVTPERERPPVRRNSMRPNESSGILGQETVELALGSRTIFVTRRSLAALDMRVDVLVSSDDNHLTHGGGVSAMMWEKAGPELERHVHSESPTLSLGQIYDTPAFGLDARRLLHVVTIDFDDPREIDAADLNPVFRRVLLVAAQHGRTVGLPLLGAGSAGVEPTEAARALCKAVRSWLDTPTRLETIVVSSPDEIGVVGREFQRLKGEVPLEDILLANAAVLGLDSDRRTPWDLARAGAPVTAVVDGLAALLDHLVRGFTSHPVRGVSAQERVEALRESLSREQALPPALRISLLEGLQVGSVVLHRGAGSTDDLLSVDPILEAIRSLLKFALPLERASFWSSVALTRGGGSDVPAARRTESSTPVRLHPNHDRYSHVPGVRTASGKPVYDCGDEVAQLLRGRNLDEIYELTAERLTRAGSVITADALRQQYAKLNLGMQRMNLSNRLRGVLRSDRSVDAASLESQPTGIEDAGAQLMGEVPSPPPAAEREAGRSALAGPERTTHPVRALHRFMEKHLDSSRLQEIDQELASRYGANGGADRGRLEFWLLEPDPVARVAQEFSTSALRRFVEDQTGKPPAQGASNHEMAATLLKQFGFSIPRKPQGLSVARAEIEQAWHDTLTGDPGKCDGAAATAARHLERVCLILIHFVCKVAFRTDPDTYFRNAGLLESGQIVRKVTLGTLVRFVERLQKDLESSDADEVTAFERDFGTRQIVPAPIHDLAASRNAVFHHRAEGERATPDQVRAFLNRAKEFLRGLDDAKPRVFPRVIAVVEIRYDRWGRKLARVQPDEGSEEHLFTDEDLRPGQMYLMFALNNPVRVDPILVPAGDIV